MVEFCPRCETVLVPVRENGKVFLVCRRCGFRKEAKSSTSYKTTIKVSEEKHARTAVIEETYELSQEERERQKELLKEYYEVFLETMAGEEESGEGED
ncbi:MAG TPA: DNA-directed RNA polymerase subunit M [Thermoproteales archaeon]|nr:DNA-directed RNA polymerase subunit M [Thermoproteales archaeon]